MSSLFRRVIRHGWASGPKLHISRIRATDEEHKAARLSHGNLRKAVEEFNKNGFVILENAINSSSLDEMLARMLLDFKRQRSSNVRWNQGRNSGNISQPVPNIPQFLYEDIWANRLGIGIVENIIGPKPRLSLATSNIALPNSQGRQAVHSDYYCEHLNFPVFLEVNIYLHDVTPQNGATEFWLGTHSGYSKADHSSPTTGWIKREVFERRAEVSPPVQPPITKGSMMIRDLRCWHAGRENSTNEPRIILGFLYSPRWLDPSMCMLFPCSASSVLETWTHISLGPVDFVANESDYLNFLPDINLSLEPSQRNIVYTSDQAGVRVKKQDYWSPPQII